MIEHPITDVDREDALRREAELIRSSRYRHKLPQDIHALDYLVLKAADELDAQVSPPSEPSPVSATLTAEDRAERAEIREVEAETMIEDLAEEVRTATERAHTAEERLARLRKRLVITASNWDGCAESVRVSRPFAASVWTAVARTLRLIRDES